MDSGGANVGFGGQEHWVQDGYEILCVQFCSWSQARLTYLRPLAAGDTRYCIKDINRNKILSFASEVKKTTAPILIPPSRLERLTSSFRNTSDALYH